MPQSPVIASPKAGQPVIVLTGGGSGGHITPLLSLARALKKANPLCQIVYVGHKGDRFDTLEEHFRDFNSVAFVNAGKFRRYSGQNWLTRLTDFRTFFLNVRDFFKVFSSTAAAYKILRQVKPAAVFSKGGFVALPVGIAAKIRGVPIITHDSDVLPGLANRIIGRWAAIHTTAMPARFYNYPKDTVRHVGIPIDERIHRVTKPMLENFKRQHSISVSSFVLLVSGGGLGSKNINDKVLAIAKELLGENPKMHIVHVTGEKNRKQVSDSYKQLLNDEALKRVDVIGFSGEFYQLVGAADMIVGRAGATSLAEFAAAAKPVILIPSPFLSGGHQLKNAQELKKDGAVEVVGEDSPAEGLKSRIDELLKNDKKRQILADKLGASAKLDAADKLAGIILGAASERS